MTSIDFFATFDESIAITRDLVEAGFRVVTEPSAVAHEVVTDEVVEALRVAPAHYLSGPLIQACVARTNIVDGALRLLPVSYSIQRQSASTELRAAFRRLAAIVERHCETYAVAAGVEILVAPRAREMLQRGEASILENQIQPRRVAELSSLRAQYEAWLARHRAAVAEAPADRRMYAWAAVANDCAQLAGVLHGLGASLDELRAMLRDAARAHLEVVRLRGATYDALRPAASWSTGSSRATYIAICRACASGGVELARALAPFVWDPPQAPYVGRGSLFGDELAQAVAYALRDLLRDERAAAQAHLDPLKRIPEDSIGELLVVQGLVRPDSARVQKGLALALAWHAKNPAATVAGLLCVPALGLASLAVELGVIAAAALPRATGGFPAALIGARP